MRYYKCNININYESIENEIIEYFSKKHRFEGYVSAINRYLYEGCDSEIRFIVWNVSKSIMHCAFYYDENKISYNESIKNIEELLSPLSAQLTKLEDIEESTMIYFIHSLLDGKRTNNILNYGIGYFNQENEFYYDYIRGDHIKHNIFFNMDEIIIDTKINNDSIEFSDSLRNELKNISKLSINNKLKSFPAHYVLATRNLNVSIDMAKSIASSLYNIKKIRSKRMIIITDMTINVFKNDYLEKVISNNKGGTILIDMTEKFGTNPIDYEETCQYIDKLIRKYRNDCLFMFTYNVNHKGYSYNLLNKVKTQVNLVSIKEAKLNKTQATKYLEQLVEKSKLKDYKYLANEYMQSNLEDSFYQSDVLESYEKFEPWCINHENNGLYKIDYDQDIMIDREEDEGESYSSLDSLIGLESVKQDIEKIIASNIIDNKRKEKIGKKYEGGCMHMIFAGNPGTAKTTVAKLFAKVAKDKGILKSGSFVMRGGNDYDCIPSSDMMQRDFKAASGGVLFIDEAYELNNVAIVALLQEMENNRSDVIVILAGYTESMETFLTRNDGLKSRIPNWINFPDYSTDELLQIFDLMLKHKGFKASSAARKEAEYILDKARFIDNFGNGRYVRNLIEKIIKAQSLRLYNESMDSNDISNKELFMLKKEDVVDDDSKRNEIRSEGEASKELEEMIGLELAKEVINKAVSTFKIKKLLSDRGISQERPSMHMVFTGNPGTAKTSIARLVAEIMRDEKILPTGKFIEAGRSDLIGVFVGETAQKVKDKFRQARGGVLFIDEAYALVDDRKGSYGDEAINTIVQEMENHRDDTVVIFAGYPKEMKKFINRNPGMKSRIAFNIEFKDYNTDELIEITQLFLKKRNLKITTDAINKLRGIYTKAVKNNDFGNGRFVRRVIEESQMNLYNRISKLPTSKYTNKLLTTLKECDIVDYNEEDKVDKERIKIGFIAS